MDGNKKFVEDLPNMFENFKTILNIKEAESLSKILQEIEKIKFEWVSLFETRKIEIMEELRKLYTSKKQ